MAIEEVSRDVVAASEELGHVGAQMVDGDKATESDILITAARLVPRLTIAIVIILPQLFLELVDFVGVAGVVVVLTLSTALRREEEVVEIGRGCSSPVNVVDANLVFHAARLASLRHRAPFSALADVAVCIFPACAYHASCRAKTIVFGGAHTISPVDEVLQLPKCLGMAEIELVDVIGVLLHLLVRPTFGLWPGRHSVVRQGNRNRHDGGCSVGV